MISINPMRFGNMRMNFKAFVVTPVLVFSFSNAFAFEYVENFERLTQGADFGEEYNKSVTSKSPVIFSAGAKIANSNDPIHAISETVPASPVNAMVAAADPEAGRTGNSTNSVLAFPFNGSPDLTKDAWMEQRFEVNPSHLPDGEKGLTEIWMQYDQYIPANYEHRDPNPTSGSAYTQGRKVLALFGDGYSSPYPTYILGARHDRTKVADNSYASHTFFWTDAAGDRQTYTRGGFGVKRLIVDPEIDKGHWQRRTLHIKLPTSETSADGVIEFWIQRLAETENPVIEKIRSISDGTFYDPVRSYLNGGYLLGYTNEGYSEDVTFLIDNFILSNDVSAIDSSAIDSSAIDSNEVAVNPPNSPSSFFVN